MSENQKLNKFSLETEVCVYSKLNALQIAKHLKVGLWLENEEQEYVDGEKVFKNYNVSYVEVKFDELIKSDEVPCFSVLVHATFESEMTEEEAKEKVVVFFGDNAPSLAVENKTDEYLIETVDYLDFLLVQDEENENAAK